MVVWWCWFRYYCCHDNWIKDIVGFHRWSIWWRNKYQLGYLRIYIMNIFILVGYNFFVDDATLFMQDGFTTKRSSRSCVKKKKQPAPCRTASGAARPPGDRTARPDWTGERPGLRIDNGTLVPYKLVVQNKPMLRTRVDNCHSDGFWSRIAKEWLRRLL